jgi:hypothetical protein
MYKRSGTISSAGLLYTGFLQADCHIASKTATERETATLMSRCVEAAEVSVVVVIVLVVL